MIKWGIVGLGKIAHKFAQDLNIVQDCKLSAVASRSESKAKEFAQEYGVPIYYTSYDKLYEDSSIDIIYIATPHHLHKSCSVAAMRKGRSVLCEKPLGINQFEVEEMTKAAQQFNVFLMEAMWTRFNPVIKEVLKRVENNEIGEVKYLTADFFFNADSPDSGRLFNMDLAGGALLDIGIYPLFLSYILLGKDANILSACHKHTSGADLQTLMLLQYDACIAQLGCGFTTDSDMIARIYGTEGNIFIDKRWHEADKYSIEIKGELEQFQINKRGKGYTYEIEECNKCIKEGKIQSKLWSHLDSLNLITLLDVVRRQNNIRYPFESWT